MSLGKHIYSLSLIILPFLFGSTTLRAEPGAPTVLGTTSDNFVRQGLEQLEKKKFGLARETFRAAILLHPEDLSLWGYYNQAVAGEIRENELGGSATTLLKTYSQGLELTYANTYRELDNLVVFGRLKNGGSSLATDFTIEIQLLDESRQILATRQCETTLGRLGIPPGMVDNFRASFSPVPALFKFYQVKIIPRIP